MSMLNGFRCTFASTAAVLFACSTMSGLEGTKLQIFMIASGIFFSLVLLHTLFQKEPHR